MEGLIEIITDVWEQGFLGIGMTEIIISMLISFQIKERAVCKQDHLRWRYSTGIHWKQLVYLAICRGGW